jgi:hypothetical protein
MNIQSNVTTPFAFIFNIPSSSARGGLFKLRVLSFVLKIATHSNALLFASEPGCLPPHRLQDLFIKFNVVRAVGIQIKKKQGKICCSLPLSCYCLCAL